jgi:hypothetical protein
MLCYQGLINTMTECGFEYGNLEKSSTSDLKYMVNEINEGWYHFGECIKMLYAPKDDEKDKQPELDSVHDITDENLNSS